MTEENKEIETDKEKKHSKCRIFASYLCIFLLFISIFFCACTNQEENKILQSEKIDTGEWIVVDDKMSKTRYPATANLLPDGNVLIMGGEDDSADTADIFDPKQMKIVKTIQLDDKRYSGYSAITLQNGNVYVFGGYLFDTMPPNITNSAKIFDAKKYEFYNVRGMNYKTLSAAKGILLENGNVLILHGVSNYKKDGNFNYQVYNPQKDEYYYTKNIPYATWAKSYYMPLNNNEILVFSGSSYVYDFIKNEFEKTNIQMPEGYFLVPLDKNSYLNLEPNNEYTYGYVYNIKENKQIPVRNHINRTVRAGNQPIFVTLKNGNVLIMGINVVKMRQETNAVKKYSSFLYDREKNMFFQIPNPPYPMSSPGIVMLQNGDILFAGGRSDKNGNKIQIYRYKH